MKRSILHVKETHRGDVPETTQSNYRIVGTHSQVSDF